ncbi:MAG: hypothetical protein ACR2Q3_14885 [Woeseiaceae bacterium]
MDITLFDQLRQLNLPSRGYAIFGSGPLAVRGIVPLTNDVDVICTDEVWGIVNQIGRMEYLPEYDLNIVTMANGALTFGTIWGIGNFDVDELIATAEIVDGLPFVRLEHVIGYKTIRASEKDLQHLKALEEFSKQETACR